jgi:hypothetical protein
VLVFQTVFAALGAWSLGDGLERAFASAGGLLAALSTPGSPLFVESLLRFAFHHALTFAATFALLLALNLALGPWLLMAWLRALVGPDAMGAALRRSLGATWVAIRLRVLLLMPLFALALVAGIGLTFTHLVLRPYADPTHDLCMLGVVALCACLYALLQVLSDLSHAALAGQRPPHTQPGRAASEAPLSAALALGQGLHTLGPRACALYGLYGVAGNALLVAALALPGETPAFLLVVAAQTAAYGRYVLRGVWLRWALDATAAASADVG